MRTLGPEDWARFCSSPDEAGFLPVYEATRGLAYTICRRVLQSREDAEEAFQGTYARLLALVRKGDPLLKEEPSRLMARLAGLEADRIRQRRRRRARREVAMDPLPESPSVETASGAVMKAELRLRLEELVESLPELYRLPIQLHYFHGLSHEEIGAALRVPTNTVSSQLARGVVNGPGQPVAGAQVDMIVYFTKSRERVQFSWAELDHPSLSISFLQVRHAITGDDGRFAFDMLPRGIPMDLAVRAPGRPALLIGRLEQRPDEELSDIVADFDWQAEGQEVSPAGLPFEDAFPATTAPP